MQRKENVMKTDKTKEEPKRSSLLDDDIFCRITIAKRMCDLICNTNRDYISPAFLDGPWGCGKTEHALRMKDYINNKLGDKHKCVYWNAAKVDYASDPLTMFIAAMYKDVPNDNKKDFEVSVGKLFGTFALGAASNVLLQTLTFPLRFYKVDEILEAGGKAVEREVDSDVQRNVIHKFLSDASNEELRIDLSRSILTALSGERETVFIIDELDRCRPDFALKMLETIKHLFSAVNCKFVIVANQFSLVSSIQKLYGLEKEEAETYISKFVKIKMRLPLVVRPIDIGCNFVYYKHLMQGKSDSIFYNNEYIKAAIDVVCSHNRLHLREIEKVVSIIHIFDDNSNKKLLKDKDPHHALIAVVIALMTVAKINLLDGMQTNSVTADDVVGEMGFDSLPHDAKKSHLKKFLLTIFSIYLSRNDNDIINIINTATEEEPNHYVNYLHLNDFLAWTIQVGLLLQ